MSQDVVDGFEYWLGFEDHAGASAKLVIVGGAVGIVGIGPNVGDLGGDQAAPGGPPDDAAFQRAGECLGEESQNVEAHESMIQEAKMNCLSIVDCEGNNMSRVMTKGPLVGF